MKKGFILFITMFAVSFSMDTYAYNILVDLSGLYHDAGIPAWLTSLGNNVTTISDYSGQNLSGYDIVMDFGYDEYTGLNDAKKAAYSSYLAGGGSLYLQGENPTGYGFYDTILLNYLKNNLGAGNITALMTEDLHEEPYPQFHNQTTTSSPVTTDTSLQYIIDFALGITNPGNGFFVVHTDTRADMTIWPSTVITGDWSSIIGFDHGNLANYPQGKLIVNFDVTDVDTTLPSFPPNEIVLEKIVDYLGADTNAVPEPATFGLVGIGVLLLAVVISRRKTVS